MARPSFEQAKAQFVHRFTCEHVPTWARERAPNGLFYAPQFVTDQQWYNSTLFWGESPIATKRNCFTTGQTWPYGQWLKFPFSEAYQHRVGTFFIRGNETIGFFIEDSDTFNDWGIKNAPDGSNFATMDEARKFAARCHDFKAGRRSSVY